MTVSGKHVVITGASRGIGEASARAFAKAGAKVTLMARSQDAIERIAQEINANAVACDVGTWNAVSTAMDQARHTYGAVDVLINNAAVIDPISHLAEADPTAWDTVMAINLMGVFYGMRAVMPEMIERGSGTIVNISSGAANHPLEGWSHYCASKAGVLMLTRTAHLESAAKGLRVMGLSPGTVATQMQKEIKSSGMNPVADLNWEDHVPPEWPAQTLMWMCGAKADPWLGQDISLRDEAIRHAVGLS